MGLVPYLSYSRLGYRGQPDKFLVDLHKINLFYLKKNFGEAHLITDSASKPFFEHLPWTSLTTELDLVPTGYEKVWCLSKLFAYREIAMRGKPFLHVDNDVALWKGLPEEFLTAEVFAQAPEDAVKYKYQPEKLRENCPRLHVFNETTTETAYNVGIFGGQNIKFILDYANAAIAFVLDPANRDFWLKYDGYWSWWCKATTAEQWFLGAFAEKQGVAIKTIFDKWPTAEEAKAANYSHLMAKKVDPETRQKVHGLADRIVLAGGELVNLGFDHL